MGIVLVLSDLVGHGAVAESGRFRNQPGDSFEGEPGED
jgi:hypothetical protein